METIVAKVNEKNLLANIGLTFSNSSTFIGEMMQNARRANASAVCFYTSINDNNLVVIDDGDGVKDFSKLLNLAESGWDQNTIQADSPFGMGFFSCLFMAETVIVESNGKKLVIDSQRALNQEELTTTESDVTIGTKITLVNFKGDKTAHQLLGEKLQYLSNAFGIPVFWNEVEMERPYALDNLQDVVVLDGMTVWHTNDIIVPGKNEWEYRINDIYAYIQGLPIYRCNSSSSVKKVFVLHLDHHVYQPRMPDRDKLRDEEIHHIEFQKIPTKIIRQRMAVLKETLPAEEFVEYWRLASAYFCLDLFNDVPLLPKQIMRIPYAEPIQSQDWHEEQFHQVTEHIKRSDVENGTEVLVNITDMVDFDVDENHGAPWLFANRKNWLYIKHSLPEGHWAQDFIREIDYLNPSQEKVDENAIRISISPVDVVAEGMFISGWFDVHVVVCDHYIVSDGVSSVVENSISTTGFTSADGKFILVVPKNDQTSINISEQIYDFLDEFGDFEEVDRDEAENRLNNFIATLNGEKPESTLLKAIRNGNIHTFNNVNGKSFVVDIADDGTVSVSLKAS